MADKTGIQWTQATWNPVVGCSIVSPGCRRCYAMREAAHLERMGVAKYAGLTMPSKAGPVWNNTVRLAEAALHQPLHWRKPRRIFVNSMSDLFHEDLPDAVIDRVFGVMALSPQHTFQVLTKRAERMRDYCLAADAPERVWAAACSIMDPLWALSAQGAAWGGDRPWPLNHVWLGVSIEDQQRADERIPALLATPAAIRFLSCEPLLGPVTLAPPSDRITQMLSTWYGPDGFDETGSQPVRDRMSWLFPKVDWVIAGGESGPGARPMHPDWARSLRDQCAAAGVAFFFKQWGEHAPNWLNDESGQKIPGSEWTDRMGKRAAGRLLDGRTHDEFPVPA